MLFFYLFAVLTSTASSSKITCENGQNINTNLLPTATLLTGNWSYSYHWDKNDKFQFEFLNEAVDHLLDCPQVEIIPVPQSLVENRKEKCRNYPMPFRWEDALLKMDAPLISLRDAIIVIGKTEHWLFVDCQDMLHMAALQVSDDVIVMINPDEEVYMEMLSRKPLMLSELKCIAHNIGIGKGMSGISLCY